MTSVREALRRLLQRRGAADEPDPEYSYLIYWTKVARQWDAARRRQALEAAEQLIGGPDFEANPYHRRYQAAEIDDARHSGASLLALRKVLRALGNQIE